MKFDIDQRNDIAVDLKKKTRTILSFKQVHPEAQSNILANTLLKLKLLFSLLLEKRKTKFPSFHDYTFQKDHCQTKTN